MKKWSGLSLSLFLMLGLISFLCLFQGFQTASKKGGEARIVLAQTREGTERKGQKDTFLIDLLKQLRQTVDSWLKSINDEIEKEDVTRFKVRFLEILRSILEWVREKIDAWLEASEGEMTDKGSPLRETRAWTRTSLG
ncbi:MAG: hypothetical protein ACUVWO_00835 [Thermodesulfobacteriota bacterium]